MRSIFNKCGSVNRLLYLYRDGELSPKEKSSIDEHTRTCSDCASLLKKLQITDSYLERYRSTYVAPANEEEIISATLQEITKDKQQSTRYKLQSPKHGAQSAKHEAPSTKYKEPIILFLRPVLIGALALILCFLCFQQLRDAFRSSALENRLMKKTPEYMAKQYNNGRETDPLLRRLRGQESKQGLFSPAPSKAAAGNQAHEKILTLWRQLFENQNGFLDYLRDRYPELSAINIDDGLDRQEREILSTEGKALIKELEQLTRYGEKQP